MKRFLSLLLAFVLLAGFALPAKADMYTSESYLQISDGYLDGYHYETDLDVDAAGDGWDWDADTFTLTLTDADMSEYMLQIFNPRQPVTVRVTGSNVLSYFELFDRNDYLMQPYSYSLELEFVGSGSLTCPSLAAPEVYFSGPTVKTDYLSSIKKVYLTEGEVIVNHGLSVTGSSYSYPRKLDITGGTLIADIREQEVDENFPSLGNQAAILSMDNPDFLSEYKMEDENGDPVTLKFASLPISDSMNDEAYVSTRADGSFAPYVKVTDSDYKQPAPPAPTVTFADVAQDAYYFEPVQWAVDMGITSGTSATTFSPDATCTRGQFVTLLWRYISGSPMPATCQNPFQDISSSDYFYDAVLWAAENGITSGTSATTFSPDAPCTRGQIATFLWRFMGQQKASTGNIFSDIASDAYYYDAVLWAVENGVTNGMGEGIFAPDAPCTRGQIVTFLYRLLA